MKICMVGTGYVGLVSGACFAEMGHEVTCVDISEAKIVGLKNGVMPIYEPGLEEIVRRNTHDGRLKFTTSLSEGVAAALFVFIAVGTPPGEDGSADLKHVLGVAREIGSLMKEYRVVVNKSTVPVGTADLVKKELAAQLASRGKTNIEFDVVSNPEFLKEGDAIGDFMRPDRIVVGAENPRTGELMKELYAPFVRNGHPILLMDVKSAELTKYAANAMLAARISFMNEISLLCDVVGADVEEVRKGIGTDSRIGMPFLYAGLGYGGSCFPKDVQALQRTMAQNHLPGHILNAVEAVNYAQRKDFTQKIIKRFQSDLRGRRFAIWGLAFKPKTDDMREAPSVYLISELVKHGAKCFVYDPESMANAKTMLPSHGVHYCDDMYQALEDADALVLVTEWNHFRSPDFDKMKSLLKTPILFDGRNQYNPEKIRATGWEYHCIGRGMSRS